MTESHTLHPTTPLERGVGEVVVVVVVEISTTISFVVLL